MLDSNTIFVLFLSMIPFIETRGAMFIGFGMGITDIWTYFTCFCINAIQIFLYPSIFKRINLSRLEEYTKKLHDLNKVFDSKAFVGLIPLPNSGINVFTSSLISYLFKFKESYRGHILIGSFIREITTFLFLSGAFVFLGSDILEPLIQILLFLLFFNVLFKNRTIIASIMGIERRKKIDTRYFVCALLVLCILLSLTFIYEAKLFFKVVMSYLFSGISDGKLYGFFIFTISILFLKSFYIGNERKIFNSIKIGAVLWIILTLIGLAIFLYFVAYSSAPVNDMLQGTQHLYIFDIENELMFTYFELTHYHSLKPTLFFIFRYVDGIEGYDLGTPILNFIPFIIYYFVFCAYTLFAISIGSMLLMAKDRNMFLWIIVSFMLLLSLLDGGILSENSLIALFVIILAGIYYNYIPWRKVSYALLALILLILATFEYFYITPVVLMKVIFLGTLFLALNQRNNKNITIIGVLFSLALLFQLSTMVFVWETSYENAFLHGFKNETVFFFIKNEDLAFLKNDLNTLQKMDVKGGKIVMVKLNEDQVPIDLFIDGVIPYGTQYDLIHSLKTCEIEHYDRDTIIAKIIQKGKCEKEIDSTINIEMFETEITIKNSKTDPCTKEIGIMGTRIKCLPLMLFISENLIENNISIGIMIEEE